MSEFQFTITKRSQKSRARLGVLRTSHGEIQTPALVTVATQGTVKAVNFDQVKEAGSQLLICNTYHLNLRPGPEVVRAMGGLHKFSGWDRPLMTDSGGFQVFSLGFGKDYGIGKIGKVDGGAVTANQNPASLKITEQGVKFRSYLDGRELMIGPEESMAIQASLGADIIFAFDECTPPNADYEYSENSMHRTHRWAERCLASYDKRQALYGIVQGGKFDELRRESARVIGALPFAGIGIGGEFGEDKATMDKMLKTVMQELPDEKPRHLLGIGHPDDIERIVKAGVDTFDCTVPTQYARHGTAFTSEGKKHVNSSRYLRNDGPLDPVCGCPVCTNHSIGYICHLLRANEITALTMLTVHNLHYFNGLVTEVRQRILSDEL